MKNDYNCLKISQIKDKNKNGEHVLYIIDHPSSPDDIIKALFKWDEKGYFVKEIEIVSSTLPRRFKHINYCVQKDCVEIHCEVQREIITTSNTPFSMAVNFYIGCVKVDLIERDIDKPVKLCDWSNTQPGRVAGNILVGG